MRVNVVCKPGWILERLARELADRLPGVRVNAGKDVRHAAEGDDLNYYLPSRDYLRCPVGGPMMGLFTHGQTGFDLIPHQRASIAMNEAMAARLRAAGAVHVHVIRPGVEPSDRGQIVFGVIGRVYNSGRKGEHLVREAVRAGYTVVACGTETYVRAMSRRQWPCPQPYTMDQRAAFYRAIDYLLVTSTEEGGPMPVPEAIAYGVPVIAPAGVGWCDEFPALGRYIPGDWPSLQAVLEALTHPPTWADWADGHARIFASVLERAA